MCTQYQITTPSFSTQPDFQQNSQIINPYGQVIEIVSLLADFDPSVDEGNDLSNTIKKLLENRIIGKSDSPYASGIVVVEKKNIEHLLCVDYRQLSKITIKTPYPMSVMVVYFTTTI